MRVLCDGILETMQRYDYNGKLEHCFTAHPKVDPDSGKAFKRQIRVQCAARFS